MEAPTRPVSAPRPVPQYLTAGRDPVFVTYHGADPSRARSTAVLLCPPFGWEEVCAYRSLRLWAAELAEAGYPALRLSYPSTGDSGGTVEDPGRVEASVAAISDAARWLRSEAGVERLVAVGLNLGALLAYLAAAGGAEIDDLVLWGCPARGRAAVRQLRAFSKLESSQIFGPLPPPAHLPDGELEAGGFRLSAETVAALDRVELSPLTLPNAEGRRILMLDRDGLAVDETLRAALVSSGAEVTTAAGSGYGAMTSHPQEARPALDVFARVQEWLEDGRPAARAGHGKASADGQSGPGPTVPATGTVTIRTGAGAVRETPITIARNSGTSLSAVLVEPVGEPRAGLAVVLLNAGAVRRIGPNRMWVEAARRWAERGVRTLRLDVAGIGDSEGDNQPYRTNAGLYVPELVPQVLSCLDELEARGWGRRYVLGGLCAGAYWSFHAALEDQRVRAAIMVNPRVLIWDADLEPSRDLRRLLSRPVSPAQILRVATPARVRALLRWLVLSPWRWRSRRKLTGEVAAVDAALERLVSSGKRALIIFSEHEPLQKELSDTGRLARLEELPNVFVEQIPVGDHTLRPNWAQQAAHGLLDAAIERELADRR